MPLPAHALKDLSTEAALCRAYDAWLADRGFTPMSADELLAELQAAVPQDAAAEIRWLIAFIEQWKRIVG
jgi:hypothetical protein